MRPVLLEQCRIVCCMTILLIAAGAGNDRYAVLRKFVPLIQFWPVPVIGKQAAAKGRLEKSVQPLDVMPIAFKLEHEGDTPVRSKHHVLTETDKPSLERGTVSFLRHAAESGLLSFPNRTTNIHRMRVYDEKQVTLDPKVYHCIYYYTCDSIQETGDEEKFMQAWQ